MFTLILAIAGAVLMGLVGIVVVFSVANMNMMTTARREQILRYALPVAAVAAGLTFTFIFF